MSEASGGRRAASVPPLLADAAGWTWRLGVLAIAAYYVVGLLGDLELVTIPLLIATLLTAGLHPVVALMRRHGASRGMSTFLTTLLAFAVLGGVGVFVANRASAGYPELVDQVNRLVTKFQHWLQTGPLHVKNNSVNNLGDKFVTFLRDRQSTIVSGAIAGVSVAVEVITGLVLTFFLTVFMLYDGDRIWAFFVRQFPERHRLRAHETGIAMWRTLSGYVTGTFTVALFHGVVMGVALAIVGVPLVAPLAVLIFLGSFIPLIGSVVFGGLAVLVTLVSKDWKAAIVILIVLLIENQVDSHVLQPIVVGRYVRLHPMAIAVVLAGGSVLAGIPGAIFGIPIVAAANAAVHYLRTGSEPPSVEAPHTPWWRRVLRMRKRRARPEPPKPPELEDVLPDLPAPPGSAPAKRPAAKKTPAKKAPAKRAPAKKKATAKKAAPKKKA